MLRLSCLPSHWERLQKSPAAHVALWNISRGKTVLKLGGALYWLNMDSIGKGFTLDGIHIHLLSKFTFYLTLNGWCFKTKFKSIIDLFVYIWLFMYKIQLLRVSKHASNIHFKRSIPFQTHKEFNHSAGVNIICINMCLTVEWQILKWLYMCTMVHYM